MPIARIVEEEMQYRHTDALLCIDGYAAVDRLKKMDDIKRA